MKRYIIADRAVRYQSFTIAGNDTRHIPGFNSGISHFQILDDTICTNRSEKTLISFCSGNPHTADSLSVAVEVALEIDRTRGNWLVIVRLCFVKRDVVVQLKIHAIEIVSLRLSAQRVEVSHVLDEIRIILRTCTIPCPRRLCGHGEQ